MNNLEGVLGELRDVKKQIAIREEALAQAVTAAVEMWRRHADELNALSQRRKQLEDDAWEALQEASGGKVPHRPELDGIGFAMSRLARE